MVTEVSTSVCDGVGITLSPGPDEFADIGPGYNLAMVSAEVSSDLETPISAFMKLRGRGACFLLESAESDEMWGRYSFLGFDPGSVASLEDGKLTVSSGAGAASEVPGDPIRAVFDMVGAVRAYIPDFLRSMPFAGGAVGYFGYDTLPYLEKVKLSGNPAGFPEMMFMFPRRLVMFDHLRSRMTLCALVEVGAAAGVRKRAYDEAARKIGEMAASLEKRIPFGSGLDLNGSRGDDYLGVESNVDRSRYEDMVARAREYILAGDAFQVVVSQRFSLPFEGNALTVYRHLRAENPSPYMFYLELPGLTLVGSSPELMVTNRGGRAVIRPIAGTRPRGKDALADSLLAAELKEDTKEKAEHVMLVDLARNDLGRVCRPRSVKVVSLMEVEKYSHVMHMVSEVEGSLKDGCSNYELLKASFPAGTVIGAPKVRASEIISELEPDRRGAYAGAIGYVSYSGDMDTCIAIRTVAIRDGIASVQAGGGIVADSRPSNEYEESRDKARAVIRAVRSAGGSR